MAPFNPAYGSVDGVLFDQTQSILIQCPGAKAGTYWIPNGVTTIAAEAFHGCTSLTNVSIPNTVTSIRDSAFKACFSLASVYCMGNHPTEGANLFLGDTNTVYYLPGTTGWGSTYGSRPTVPWVLPHPLILTIPPTFGLQNKGFGFIISWATNLPVVVEACTDLDNPAWSPVGTNTLTSGSSYFSDPAWTNYSSRFYRIRSS